MTLQAEAAPAKTARAYAPETAGLVGRMWDRLGQPADGREVPGTFVVAGIAAVVALVASVISWRQGWLLLYPDALSHLSTARRVIDSQNPGFYQLGTLWLPVPHLLLIPFVAPFPLFASGLASVPLGIGCLAITASAIWRICARVGLGRIPGLVAVGVFIFNPTMLFLTPTALTEPVLIAAVAAGIAGLAGWIMAMPSISPGQLAVFAGVPATIAVLSRYEGWIFVAVATMFVIVASWRRWRSKSYTLTLVVSFLSGPVAGVIWWVIYNYLRFGDPLAFARGPGSAAEENARYIAMGLLPSKGNLGWTLRIFDWSIVDIIGLPLLCVSVLGGLILIWTRGLSTTGLLLWMPAFFPAFAIASLYLGQTNIFNEVSLPEGVWKNNRYAVGALILVGLLCAVAVEFFINRWPRIGAALAAAILIFAMGFTAWSFLDADHRMGVVREGNYIATPTDGIAAANWLGDNYEGGYILMEDDPQGGLQLLGVPLDQVISIYNGSIFASALADPAGSAEWVFVNSQNAGGPVWKAINEDSSFTSNYSLAYESGKYRVFRRIQSTSVAR